MAADIAQGSEVVPPRLTGQAASNCSRLQSRETASCSLDSRQTKNSTLRVNGRDVGTCTRYADCFAARWESRVGSSGSRRWNRSKNGLSCSTLCGLYKARAFDLRMYVKRRGDYAMRVTLHCHYKYLDCFIVTVMRSVRVIQTLKM